MVRVSIYVGSNSMPLRLAAIRRKRISKEWALWATRIRPAAKLRKACSASASPGASATISLVMPVSSVILGVMGLPGLTKVSNSSTTSPFRTITAPISVRYSTPGSRPVVSVSNTQNSPSSGWSFTP